jgi:hypothetical protein
MWSDYILFIRHISYNLGLVTLSERRGGGGHCILALNEIIKQHDLVLG